MPSAHKKRMQLHISGINMLQECGIRFEFRYIKGIRRRPNAFTIAGTGTDRAVGADLNSKISTKELLPDSDVKDIAADAVRHEADREDIELIGAEEKGFGAKQVISLAVDKAVRLSSLHHAQVAPAMRPAAVARKFSIIMDKVLRNRAEDFYAQSETASGYFKKILASQGRSLNAMAKSGLEYCGEQDIVERYHEEEGVLVPTDEVLVIRDTKTSAKSPSKDSTTGRYSAVDDSEQLTGYAFASHILDGRLPNAVGLDYLVDLKTGPKSLSITSTRTMDDIEVFMARFTNAVHALHTGVFVPAKPDDWRCSEKWCGYWSMCPYAKRPKTVAVPEFLPAADLVQIELNSEIRSPEGGEA